MSTETEDTGIIEAVLQRLNDFRLPRLLELKERVDEGATLSEYDLDYLERVMDDFQPVQGVIQRHPELETLFSKMTSLYQEITSKALDNEKNSKA